MAAISQQKLGYVKQLYYGEKKSAPEIACTLAVSLDAVYYFMRRNKLRRRGVSENNQIIFNKKAPSFNVKLSLTDKEKILHIAGIMLYWAEGYQAAHASGVDFSNSKPEMITVFLEFLRRICKIDESRLRVYLYCHANQDSHSLISFWSRLTGIPKKQFTRPYVRSDFDPKKIGKMKQGLIHIRYYDKKLLEQLRFWIREFVEHLHR